MTALEIAPHERFRLHGVDPADVVTADADAVAEHVAAFIASLRPAWHHEALCRGEPLDWWFPGVGQRHDAAMEICGRCPVREQCLDDALADPDLDHGVRGGATANARRAMRRARGIEPAPRVCTCLACDDCRARRAAAARRYRRKAAMR